MQIEKTVTADSILLAISGRIDTTTSDKLQSELAPIWEEGGHDIVLDFAAVQYISSAGLRVLLMSQKKCRANAKKMTITGANQAVCEIFDITGFSSMLNIV